VKERFEEPQAGHYVVVHHPHVRRGGLESELEAAEKLEVEGRRGVVQRAPSCLGRRGKGVSVAARGSKKKTKP
jgi:hypothetical protein